MVSKSEVNLFPFLKSYIHEVMDRESKIAWINKLCRFYNKILHYVWIYEYEFDSEKQSKFEQHTSQDPSSQDLYSKLASFNAFASLDDPLQ